MTHRDRYSDARRDAQRDSLYVRGFGIVALAAVLVGLTVFVLASLIGERVYERSAADSLIQGARTLAPFVPGAGTADTAAPGQDFEAFCARSGSDSGSGIRVTLIARDGRVLGDSGASARDMENHAARPEIAAALGGKASWSLRTSATLGTRMLYAAIPLELSDNSLSGMSGSDNPLSGISGSGNPLSGMSGSDNSVSGTSGSGAPDAMAATGGQSVRASVLRLALPLPLLMERAKESRLLLALAAILAVLVALVTSAILMRMLAHPITVLAEKARLYPASLGTQRPFGSLIALDRLPREFSILGQALDGMASDLTRRTGEAEDLGRRYATILESAGEGILAVDGSLTITEANPASQELLGQSGNTLIGKGLPSIPGAEPLADLARRCMESGKPEDGEILLFGSERERSIQAKATSLAPDPAKPGEGRGAVLAFSDITILKRLERVRSDFVSNVSHELRTPIHLIRGFSETAKAELESPSPGTEERLEHYLDIIEKHALRMERIVADLLSLARLERDSSTWLSLELCDSAAILAEVVDTCSPQAKAKSINLETGLPCAFTFQANRGLIEQALINLVENAIRYSPEGSAVILNACTEDHHAIFRVIDRGSGIPEPALTRIFERFYRLDKARDRKSGGTGLGLAIVRHIALAHGGEAHAQSWAGEGSIFTIRIPLKGAELATQDGAKTGRCE